MKNKGKTTDHIHYHCKQTTKEQEKKEKYQKQRWYLLYLHQSIIHIAKDNETKKS